MIFFQKNFQIILKATRIEVINIMFRVQYFTVVLRLVVKMQWRESFGNITIFLPMLSSPNENDVFDFTQCFSSDELRWHSGTLCNQMQLPCKQHVIHSLHDVQLLYNIFAEKTNIQSVPIVTNCKSTKIRNNFPGNQTNSLEKHFVFTVSDDGTNRFFHSEKFQLSRKYSIFRTLGGNTRENERGKLAKASSP